MPPHHPKVLAPPQPTKIFFDPFNSSSTGHQTAPSKLSGTKGWHDSRSRKLAQQFSDASGRGGAAYLSDLVGAGSENWQKDGRKENGDWEKGAIGLREDGWQDIRGLFSGKQKKSGYSTGSDSESKSRKRGRDEEEDDDDNEPRQSKKKYSPSMLSPSTSEGLAQNAFAPDDSTLLTQPTQIFRGLTIFLNGSTAPLVSDHKLKQLFASHGGNSSIALGRRTVTHVIVGDSCGGGLASGKFQKEVKTVRGKSIKFVTARWVLDSVEKGIRQPEGNYQARNVASRIGGSGQKSVAAVFGKKT